MPRDVIQSERPHMHVEKVKRELDEAGYGLERMIAYGGFGTVYLTNVTKSSNIYRCTGSTNQVVMKVIAKKSLPAHYQEFIQRELTIHRVVSKHPHIVCMYHPFETESFSYLPMDYCECGDLCDLIQQQVHATGAGLPEHEARRFYNQMTDAVGFCHQNGIIHRDLKCENMLIDSKRNIKITDFGFSMAMPHCGSLLQEWCGSIQYAAPEIILEQWYDGTLADVWSLGVVLFSMVTGHWPLEHCATVDEMLHVARSQDYHLGSNISKELKLLLLEVLQFDPEKRLDIEAIMRHPWCRSEKLGPGNYLFMDALRNQRKPFRKNYSSLPVPSYSHSKGRSKISTVTVGQTRTEAITLRSRRHANKREWSRMMGLSYKLHDRSLPASSKLQPLVDKTKIHPYMQLPWLPKKSKLQPDISSGVGDYIFHPVSPSLPLPLPPPLLQPSAVSKFQGQMTAVPEVEDEYGEGVNWQERLTRLSEENNRVWLNPHTRGVKDQTQSTEEEDSLRSFKGNASAKLVPIKPYEFTPDFPQPHFHSNMTYPSLTSPRPCLNLNNIVTASSQEVARKLDRSKCCSERTENPVLPEMTKSSSDLNGEKTVSVSNMRVQSAGSLLSTSLTNKFSSTISFVSTACSGSSTTGSVGESEELKTSSLEASAGTSERSLRTGRESAPGLFGNESDPERKSGVTEDSGGLGVGSSSICRINDFSIRSATSSRSTGGGPPSTCGRDEFTASDKTTSDRNLQQKDNESCSSHGRSHRTMYSSSVPVNLHHLPQQPGQESQNVSQQHGGVGFGSGSIARLRGVPSSSTVSSKSAAHRPQSQSQSAEFLPPLRTDSISPGGIDVTVHSENQACASPKIEQNRTSLPPIQREQYPLAKFDPALSLRCLTSQHGHQCKQSALDRSYVSCRTLLIPEKCSSKQCTKKSKKATGQPKPAMKKRCTWKKPLLKTSKIVPMLGMIKTGDIYVATLTKSTPTCMSGGKQYAVRPGGNQLMTAHTSMGFDYMYTSPYRIARMEKK